MWTAPVAVREGDLPRNDSPAKLFSAGMAVTLGNPKIMMFYLALLPTIIDLGSGHRARLGRAHRHHGAGADRVDLAWTAAAAQARRMLKSARAMRIANRVSATTMAGAAAAIAAR